MVQEELPDPVTGGRGPATLSGMPGWALIRDWSRSKDGLRLFTVLALLIGVLHVALFFAFAPATRVLRPHSDMFDLLDEGQEVFQPIQIKRSVAGAHACGESE